MVVSPADRSWGWPAQKTFLWISAVTAGVEGRPFSVFAKDFMPVAHFSLEGPFPTRLLWELDGLVPSVDSQLSREKKRTIASGTPWGCHVSAQSCLFISCTFSFFLFFLKPLGIISALSSLPSDVFPNKASFVSTVKYVHSTLLFGQIGRGC